LEAATRPLANTTRGWDAYFMRCFALGESGRVAEAIEDCERSLELNDRHLGTHELLSGYYYGVGRYESALETLDRMIAIASDDALALANRGAVHRELGDYDRALDDLERALRLEPLLDTAYRERALTWLAMDNPAAAMTDARLAALIDSESATNLYTLGYVGTYGQEYELVIESMDQALSMRPDAAFYNMRGYAYALQGDHERGLEDVERALLLDPSSPHAHDSRGVAHLRAGSLEPALADLARALELLPSSDTSSRAEFLYHQALVQEALGQDTVATSTLEEASGLGTLPAVRRQIDDALARLVVGQ
jgi:tetratricopeptide (TPR) repeat protein